MRGSELGDPGLRHPRRVEIHAVVHAPRSRRASPGRAPRRRPHPWPSPGTRSRPPSPSGITVVALRIGLITTAPRTSDPPPEVRERLLTAWRGEILAGAVYELIARRLDDREADILRRMAEAESGHRRRLEERMTELGIAIPDPATVRVPLWLRLQARIAPVDRLLAAREAAEDEEVDDLYKRSTGDADDRSAAAGDPQGGALALAGRRRPARGRGQQRRRRRVRRRPARRPALGAAAAAVPDRLRRRRADRHPRRAPAAGQDPRPGEVAPDRARAGSPARSTAPTTASRPCSGSWPASRAPPAARARC